MIIRLAVFCLFISFSYYTWANALPGNMSARSSRYFAPWGSQVDVANKGDIIFIFRSSHPAQEFQIRVIEYGGFSCRAKMLQRDKNTIFIQVRWLPGADMSGCHLHLYYKPTGQYLGRSSLYMIY